MKTLQGIVDLEHPDQYVIVRMIDGVDLAPDNDDLRVLDQTLGPAIHALWSEKAQSIAAFFFDKTHWDEDGAKAWIDKAKEEAEEEDGATAAAGDDAEGGREGPGDEDPDTAPLFGFWLALGDGAAAGEDDGLIWKEVLHPGTWFRSDTGRGVQVTPEIIESVYQAFEDGYPRYVSVPADHHHMQTRGIVPPESNRGFVKRLKKVGDRLYAGFQLLRPETRQGVLDGTIADVSVYLQPGVYNNQTGRHYDWALRHVLLTNNPMVPDLATWGDIPATDSADGQVINLYQREGVMPHEEQPEGGQDQIVLSGEAAAEYNDLRARGYTAAQLLALAEQQAALEEAGLSLEDLIGQARTVRQRARELEVTAIVKALEGAETHPGIAQVEGFRHYPVVIDAVQTALESAVEDLAFSADADGQTEVDALILGVVNAIPKEGRVPVAATEQRGPKDKKPEDETEEEAGEFTDEAADEYLASIGA